MNGILDEAILEHDDDGAVACPRHPQTMTLLRCYQCGTPICPKCAQRTQVGYVCPECFRGRRKKFEQADNRDLLWAGLVAFALALPASLVLGLSGWFVIVLSPLAGQVCAGLAFRAARRHHSEKLLWVVVGAMTAAALLVAMVYLAPALKDASVWLSRGPWLMAHAGLMAASAWWYLKV